MYTVLVLLFLMSSLNLFLIIALMNKEIQQSNKLGFIQEDVEKLNEKSKDIKVDVQTSINSQEVTNTLLHTLQKKQKSKGL